MDKLKMQTANKADENFKKLAAMFPNAVTETIDENGEVVRAIDKDVLMQEINTKVVDGNEERYQFTWPDKKKSVLLANAPINKTLRPCREESVDFDNTENLYIEGDNLEVLKLLQETYLGKIKMIYIDPPYNTGNDFVYNDEFGMRNEEWNEVSGNYDEDGNQIVGKLEKNTEANGRFHTDWLNMIYPRLKLARDLLTEDGVIFISIDDNEQENLKKCCDEIFGNTNFISEFPRVTKKGGKSTDTYARNHDYVLCYCKSIGNVRIQGITHIDEGFKYKDEYFDLRGAYKLNQTLDYNTLQYNKTMDYILEIDGKEYVPGGDMEEHKRRHSGIHAKHDWVWRWSKDLFEFGYKNGWVVVSNTGRIYTKTYLNAKIEKNSKGEYYIEYAERKKALSTLEFTENGYSNDNSNKEISKIMGSTLFDYVKPTSLIKMLAQTATDNSSYVLDFFSGSATTAHAVMQLNAEDGGHRKFIMVQLPEATDEKSEAYKAGYKNICEIGKERIRRAAKKIKEEIKIAAPFEKAEKETGLAVTYYDDEAKEYGNSVADKFDGGFRVLKCDTSNMKNVYYSPSEFGSESLNELISNIKEDRTPEDLLFQVMLDLGILLSSKIQVRSEKVGMRSYSYFDVEDGYLIACFDKNIDEEVITAIAKQKPYYFVMRDSSMATDSVGTNFEQIFATYSPDTVRKVL